MLVEHALDFLRVHDLGADRDRVVQAVQDVVVVVLVPVHQIAGIEPAVAELIGGLLWPVEYPRITFGPRTMN